MALDRFAKSAKANQSVFIILLTSFSTLPGQASMCLHELLPSLPVKIPAIFYGPTQMPPLPGSLVWSLVPELLYISTLVPDLGHSYLLPSQYTVVHDIHTLVPRLDLELLEGREMSYFIFVSSTPPITVFPDRYFNGRWVSSWYTWLSSIIVGSVQSTYMYWVSQVQDTVLGTTGEHTSELGMSPYL